MGDSKVADFYENQHVLITGATGFMGKVLVEKLLRSCPKIGTIYLLIRNKKGKESAQRLNEFLNCPIFEQLKNNQKDVFNKLQVVQGDVTFNNLNLNNQDFTLLKDNVTMIFHMAANVRFDQALKPAVLMNTGGTKNVLDLACHFKQLLSFVHVSTSYCHCDETELKEQTYPVADNPMKILDMVQWMRPEVIKSITPHLLKNSPNTYAYTKALTEQLVNEYSTVLPVAIARPSIVTASVEEPFPGWVDNLNGPTGIFVGAGKGVIRTMYCNPDLFADLVPVDCVINSLILIGWKRAVERKNETDVYHIVANRDNQISWGRALEIGRRHFFNNPFSVCLWYPGGGFNSNYFLHMLTVIFLHYIPAYFVDFLMILTRNKPFLVRTQNRITNGLSMLQYYTTRPWYFHDDKLRSLYKKLNETDRKTFFPTCIMIDYDRYILNYILGARKYCVREDPETIPHAKRVLKRLYYLDLVKNILLFCLFMWIFVYISGFFLNLDTSIHSGVKHVVVK